MFLFEGSFGNILHTGDCRLTPECLQNLPEKYLSRVGKTPLCQLDFVFLDCTFGKSLMKIPSKHSSIQQVNNCIWKHPDAPTVYLTCDLLGQEEILVHVFKTFGSKIFVDKDYHSEFYKVLELLAPQIISDDPTCRFHLYEGFPKLYERAQRKLSEAREKMEAEPLIIRPSAQWYACEETELTVMERKAIERSNIPVKDRFGIWHVCYSMHSSRQELEWALELVSPKWVVSTTPECRAMELEYVRKHCFNTQTSGSLFWKLLDIGGEDSTKVDNIPSIVETKDAIPDEHELQKAEILSSESKSVLLNLSPLSKKPTVTLFGRARLGYDSCILGSQTTTTHCTSFEKIPDEELSEALDDSPRRKLVKVAEIEVEKADEGKTDIDILRKDSIVCKSVSYSNSIGSENGLNENLRKLYRSMNAPVPRPIPSLLQLMKGFKRHKRRL